MWFSPRKFQMPQVMADKTSRVGFRTISYAKPRRIYFPTASPLFKSAHLTIKALKNFIDDENNTCLFDCLKLWEHPVNTLIRYFP